MQDLNASTKAYLENYLSLSNPKFAVLLSAPWGAGKTHLINGFLEDGDDDKPLYVSLFGVSSRGEVDRAIVRALWPKSDSEAAKWGTQFKNFISGIKGLGFSLDLSKVDLTEVMLARLPKTLIFDDLERATLSVTDLLGAINNYVEHQGKRVVLLANEKDLWGKDELKEKEKVIGQTLSVVADFDAAIEPLISSYGLVSKSFLQSNIEIIKDVFVKAAYNNLRSLGQAIWEFDRLFNVLDVKLIENEEGMKELLFVFLALTLEVKAGTFTREDLQLRGGIDFNNKPEYAKLREAKQKFDKPQIQDGRFQTSFPYKIAESIICDGYNDGAAINGALALTSAFHVAKEEEDWQTVWWAFQREESSVTPAVASMEEKFKNREYLDPGVILLVFSVRLSLPQMGYSKLSLEDIEAECMAYIEELLGGEKLAAYDPIREAYHNDGFGYSDDEYLGMGFPRVGTSCRVLHFKRLFSKMREAQKKAYYASSAENGEELMRLLVEDTSLFSKKISGHILKEATFASKPVLKEVSSDDFAKALINLPAAERQLALGSLEERYKRKHEGLEGEKPWLKEVCEKLETELEKCSAFVKWQTANVIKHSIRKTLDGWAENESDLATVAQSDGDD